MDSTNLEVTKPTMDPENCGYCNKTFSLDMLSNPIHRKKCCVCDEVKGLHPSCAKKIYNFKQRGLKRSQVGNISIDAFTAIDLQFYCKQCKQLECYICEVNHSQSKLKLSTPICI